jgi:hypothetical protein
LRTKSAVAEVTDTPQRLATNMFSMRTVNGSGFDRVSGKVKVWVEGSGWHGIGEDTKYIPPAAPGTPVQPQTRPPVQVGQPIRVEQGQTFGADRVATIGTQPRKSDETLYQLFVQPVDNPSSFIANGVLVKGITVRKGKLPPPPPPGGNGQPPPPPPPDDDDDEILEVEGQGESELDPPPQPPTDGTGEGKPRPGEPGTGKPDEKDPGEGPSKPGKPQPGKGKPKKGAGDKQKPKKRLKAPVDDHGSWRPIPGRLQREAMRRWAKKAVDRMKKANVYGTLPADLVTILEQIMKEPGVSWRQLLRQWVGGRIRKSTEHTRKRPSRRHGWDTAGKKVLRGAHIWVAVDNSGSVTPQEAEQFAAEFIDILKGGNEGILIVWDTAIVQVKRIRNGTDLQEAFRDLGGGGGSTGVPLVFEALRRPYDLDDNARRLLTKKPTGIIVFTDGDIRWPSMAQQPPMSIPVLWGITRQRNIGSQPFGEALYIDVEDID